MQPMAPLLPLEDAQALVLGRVEQLASESVPLREAAGRVLAEPLVARIDLPPFPSSAMDGFAVRARDAPGTLPVVFRIAAGRPAPRPLGPGEAMAIATGGLVPDGADAVVPIESVVDRGNEVEIPEPLATGRNVRPRVGDVRAGEMLFRPGTTLRPAHVAAAAAAGWSAIVCARRPRAAVLATGTELRAPGEALRPGEIYEANGTMLAAALEASGAAVELLPRVGDDEASHRAAIEGGLQADVLATSGGVSVGPHDLVRSVQAELGVEEVFWRVAVKPGKPIVFGTRGRTLVFGLPGNPVSSLVGFELFVRPAILALQGSSEPLPRYEVGRLARPIRRDPARDELARATRVRTEDGALLEPLTGQESHMIARAARADALVLVRRGEGELAAGSAVPYLSLAC